MEQNTGNKGYLMMEQNKREMQKHMGKQNTGNKGYLMMEQNTGKAKTHGKAKQNPKYTLKNT
jgi:hypothetical protein